jgi:hypothetical protein
MYPENPEGTQVIVGSMNMGYISDTARNRTHNLFRPKREPIPLGHSDGVLELWSDITYRPSTTGEGVWTKSGRPATKAPERRAGGERIQTEQYLEQFMC